MPKFNLKTMKLFGFVLLPIFIIGFFVVNNYFANAQVPDFINYKGRLTNSSDEAITSATTIQFSLYNSDSTGSPTDIASSGGPLLWKEVFDQASGDCVKVTPNSNGYFSVKLGSCEAFPAYLTFNSDLYLGIKIGSDSEASPRIKLGAHPFARNSATVNTFSATSTATAGQLLALDDDLGFNINTGSYSGASFTMSSSTATSSIVGNFSVSGDMFLAGSLFDNSASAGAIGMVLQSTGSGLNWVATSSLGIKVGGLYGINSESLATDKTLVSGVDDIYQYLDPNGVNRNISLDKASASAGDRFVIKHNGSYDSSYYLIVKNGAVDIDWVYADAIKEYIFNGSDWVSTESGAGYNVAIGPYVSAINEGTAVGWGSWADNFGTALGISAYGKNEGVAVGYAASGDDYGVGIGYAAYGDDEGVGIGYASSGNASGTAVGYIAAGANQGVAIGYSALGSNSGVAVGYSAEGDYSGVAVGYLAKGDYSGVALGYEAQGYQHGVAIGYQAGLNIEVGADRGNIVVGYKAGDNITTGSKNILIGYDVDAPSATSANTLNIGNLLFGTGIDGIGTALSSGNVGIGTSTPWKKLSVAGDVSITGALFDSNSASGTAGMVLQSTGSGTNWVNTSSLGIEVGGAYGINVETLTGHKTLTPDTDEVYQYLNPNGANRDVTLDTASASAGNRFVIKNNGTYTISYYLTIKQGLTAIEYIYAGGIKEFVFDGTNWVSADNGSGDNDNRRYNVSIGYAASGYGNSVAIGYAAKGYSFGVAVGPGAEGYSAGAVLGYTAKGYSDGVAIGYGARGMNQGVAIGYDAGRNISTTGNLGNIVIGYQAGDNITSGSKNIVIGYNIDAPSATSANTLNIGNLLFGTGIDGTGTTLSSGNIGIGTSTPYAKLSLVDTTADNTDDVFVISTSTSGAIFKVQGSGEVYADGSFNSTGADYAEYYYTKDTDLKSGELVCIDIERENAVSRCQRASDGNLMGIVSSNPSIVGNSKDYYRNNSNYVVVGMLGQVPAFVSDENGPIRPGDSLTSASVSGVAMRAQAGDPTVGVALQKLDSGTGKINVLISRKNKSMSVSEVESQITERIAQMEIEDEVNILIANAVNNLDLNNKINEVLKPQIDVFNADLNNKTASLLAKIDSFGNDLNSLALLLDSISGDLNNQIAQIKQSNSQILRNNGLIIDDSFIETNLSFMNVDKIGNVGLGIENPEYKLHVAGEVGSEGFVQVLGNKISLNDIDSDELLESLEKLNFSDADSLPFEILSNNQGGVDLFRLNAYLVNIVKNQQKQINSITHPGISLDSIAFSAGDNLEINNLSVWGEAYFRGIAKFEKEIVFGKDSAGQVLILPGDDQAYVGFEEAYLYNPIVSLTLASRAILDSYYISEASSTGFAIKIEPVLDQEVLFNWQAISVDDLQIKKSREELQVLEAEEGQIEAENDNSVGLDLVDENTEDVFQDEENLEELEENIGEQDFSGEELAPEADENQDIENIDDSENNDYISEESDL